jgi:uncharacterized membrane protein (DUF485 family)
MKSFNQWLNTITILIVAVVMIDLNITWLRHPANTNTAMKGTIITASLLLVLLILWNIFSKANQKKHHRDTSGDKGKY